MSNKINKIFVDKMGGHSADTFIGQPGEIFYDPETGSLKISDGVTPGGKGIVESSPLESPYIGDWVYFVRPNDDWDQEISYQDVVDKIAPNLWIKRAPYGEGQGSLFNAAPNPENNGDPFDSNGGVNTPAGTQWNTDGWQDLSTTKDRYYDDLQNTFSGGGWATVKHEYIMHDTLNDKYYAIRFLSWDGGDNQAQGGFSYIRREINTDIYFNRVDTNDETEALENGDHIADNLVITRKNGNMIFNYGLGERTDWTPFNLVDLSIANTYYENTVSFDTPTGDLLDSLTQLKVGDEVFFEWDGGSGSTTVASVYNPTTMSFTVNWNQGTSHALTVIYMNWTHLDHLETTYSSNNSPKNTLWSQEGWDDLTNLKDRQWILFNDLTNGEAVGTRIAGKEFVMWDTANDKYYAIMFTRWAQGEAPWAGGNFEYPGFSYTRRLIDTEKLSAGLKFNDGTVQNTAYSTKIAGIVKTANSIQAASRFITSDDIGKMIVMDGNGTNTIRIPDAGAHDFPIGSTITIVNISGGTVYVYKWNDNESGTIFGAGTADQSTGWQIPDNGGGNIAVLIKVLTGMDGYTNSWMLSGAGIQTD